MTPSFPAPVQFEGRYQRGVEQFKRMGFKVKGGICTYKTEGDRSSSIRNRADELMVLTEERMCTIEGRSLMTNHLIQITQTDFVPHRLTYWQNIFESLARMDPLNR